MACGLCHVGHPVIDASDSFLHLWGPSTVSPVFIPHTAWTSSVHESCRVPQVLESRKRSRQQQVQLREAAARAAAHGERAAAAERRASSQRRAGGLSRRVMAAQCQALLQALDTLQVRVPDTWSHRMSRSHLPALHWFKDFAMVLPCDNREGRE